ncbi:Do family serine endopeptidase [Burkholderia pseudomallei]|uniref:Do family serine endopeptidase n=4 Tax=Burkholderia pseudomallei TaxID=28450 RepID=UPI000977EBD3|nr:Do family serine endopeptidase [Burkholderia pseudomallei]MBM5588883.1 Do family serine endopeptidase [Burkholderia pseudomallei]MBM5621922.1 Do family serine endopeptidase [Burkholderia pseudomallei]MBM5631839.1 Do family serine endopeptidase [Burkholderia pseudomallei]MBM5690943.1 Do family serine endopeptidase [Burkholderia pseudomallei]ONC51387.1 peptidase [Burkholderia pseudomallei]
MNGTRQILRRVLVAGLFVTIVHLAAGSTVVVAATADAMIAPTPSLTVPDFATLVKRYGPAVVNISVTHEVTQMGIQLPPGIAPGNPLAPFLARRVIGNREELSLGSGFIVSSDGYILTNRHVVGDASIVNVKLTDKREFKGRVIGSDTLSDVALVKIDVDHLPAVVFGNPDKAQVGDWVMAIGSPYGFANTVTAGIVSAKSRSLAGETYIPFIQTDVPINPGNSGGPLFDLNGQVVGINSMIYSKTGGYQGISFAIPIDVALDVKDQLLKAGKVTRGTIGVTAQEMSQLLARSFKVPTLDGALISSVAADGPAARAGLQSGDVVMAVNGERLSDAAELFILIAKIKPGDPADLLAWRGGQEKHIVVTVGALNSTEPSVAREEVPARLGMTVRPLTPDEQRRVAVSHGLLVEQVRGRVTSVGLRPGDIILSVNESPVDSISQLTAAINQAHGNVALLIKRNRARIFLSIDLNGL